MFRLQCRSYTISSGRITGNTSPLKLGTFAIRRDVTISGNVATCEVTVSWSDTRGNGVFTDSLQLGTVARQGQ